MDEVLSPEEVETASFPDSFDGYDKAAVDAFLQSVAEVVRGLQLAAEDLKQSSDKPYLALGKDMGELLQHAREVANAIETDARAEATQLVHDATQEAARTKSEAGELKKRLEREAQSLLEQAQARLDKAEEEAEEIRRRAEGEASIVVQTAKREAKELRDDAKEDAERTRNVAAQTIAERTFEAEKRIRRLQQAEIAVARRAEVLKTRLEALKRTAGEPSDEELVEEESPQDRVLIISDDVNRPVKGERPRE